MKQPTGNLLTNCISSFLSFLIYYHWCSRAIMAYLVGQYCKDKENNLYPADPQKRAIVDRMLYFDIGTLYKSMVDYFVSLPPPFSFLYCSIKVDLSFE